MHSKLLYSGNIQQVIRIICQTLKNFDEDNLIPVFGFGDIFTQGREVFPFIRDRPCQTLDEVNSLQKDMCESAVVCFCYFIAMLMTKYIILHSTISEDIFYI